MRADTSSLLECSAECSLSYAKIMQMRADTSSLLECSAERSLSYAKIMQISNITKYETKLRTFSKISEKTT